MNLGKDQTNPGRPHASCGSQLRAPKQSLEDNLAKEKKLLEKSKFGHHSFESSESSHKVAALVLTVASSNSFTQVSPGEKSP